MGKATRESYGIALLELGRENDKVVVLDADLSKSTKTNGFKGEFKDRFFNAGIAEQNLMGMAAGFANVGCIPFASTFAVFATGRAFEIIRNSICYPKMNVKIAATHAGITVGEDGGSHQSIEDIALMCSLPNMTVIVPADDREARSAVRAAAEFEGPVYLRFGRCNTEDIFDEDYKFEIGKGVEIREGNDVAIIATGMMVQKAIEASKILEDQGIKARVINISTIKPIDREIILKAAKETKGIITAEEHSIIGGLGAMVSQVVCSECPTKVKMVGIEDTFGESGTPDELMEKYKLTSEAIVQKVKEILE
ncbi:1-deoxy-D-xylulose-5-phosphate synthase [Clostridium saccharobutylicum]|uniref:transketolase family protein n=1 Tax=Clostridium saccharobutylicum TaxID=169679 RepID=UPI000983BB73|nr:transketolase family protein [Clostridium saccharobutylicum]AQS11588.1 1-deoxy-D-xylulose-5-phosphate synthase [Clostridium saccharobutylicum]MBC2435056.1 transketolase family protein [Clostridium saccharobutylicum]NSB86686.1 transketolase [Clostridium saccharobutylicum]NYC30419.1 transketolase [Clostridium saccharobutylicum]OOM12507.1 1-deoxy-D-xylulose-5-phosphate synthase [Clostridium saccharobutylicum]